MIYREFPTRPNREIFGGLQGIRITDQGNYPPYQGIWVSGRFWIISEALKTPFPPILAGNRSLAMPTASPSWILSS
jgi:hypothetical protein